MGVTEAFDLLIARLSDSSETGWAAWSPGEVAATLIALRDKQMLSEADKRDLRALLAPTGPVQEIAIASNWHDDYMKCAAALDRYAL
ncbi:MAG: hypothetical protein SNJ69_07365 [Chloroflexaceae bacterium]